MVKKVVKKKVKKLKVVEIIINKGDDNSFFDAEESLSDNVVEFYPLDEFEWKKSDIFLKITNWVSYRPGHVDQWIEKDGKVYLIDDLNEDEAIEYDLTKDQILDRFKEFI